MYQEEKKYAGPSELTGGPANGRSTAAMEITQMVEALHSRAVNLADRVQGQLSQFSLNMCDDVPTCTGPVQRTFPLYFQNLRDNIEATMNLLNAIDSAMDRAEL